MEVLSPRTLDEALEMKGERPEALPIAGGTDVMVELNFDRHRPDTIIDVSRGFFLEVVRPILEREFPEETAQTAFGLFGYGSEALRHYVTDRKEVIQQDDDAKVETRGTSRLRSG